MGIRIRGALDELVGPFEPLRSQELIKEMRLWCTLCEPVSLYGAETFYR